MDQLPDVPKVTLFASVEGYPSVTFDNKSGFSKALRHIIEKHGVRNIGYVSGPRTNKDAIERLGAFREVMADEGIEVKEDHIVYGDFTESSDVVVRDLLSAIDTPDALVFANDNMAIGGYRVLKERDLVPGKDICVLGFDDDVFSGSMDPPLTTVEASSADLTYKAVLNARNFMENRRIEGMEVETYMVQRNSCGCHGLDVEEMGERLHIDQIGKGGRNYIESVKKYLFGIFDDDETMIRIKSCLDDFCIRFTDFIMGYDTADRDETDRSFRKLLKTNILEYTTPERFFNILQTMQHEAALDIKDSEKLITVNEMFSGYYRQLSFAGVSISRDNTNRMERVSRLVNKQTGDIFLMSNEQEIPYMHLLEGLSTVGFRRSFLYLFQGNIKNPADGDWKCPKTVLLKAMSDETGVRALGEQQQLLRTELMFGNEHNRPDRRLTMTVFPLFVGEDLYGMLVNELDSRDFGSVSPVAYQLSVTLKSLIMIEEQNKVKKSLQDSLEQFMKDNSLLDEMSKSDELTGLYNRRGFIDYTQKAISDPGNRGKKALILYADMDNLKMVNDKYGHDDGDFALREIGSILKDAFRNTDIIGRLGGDEFTVFAIVGIDHYEAAIRQRIEAISKRHNEAAGKPYPIEISASIYEFECSPDIDLYEILDIADERLYAEKTAKKAKNGSYR